jgi:hypothetical protein
LLPRLKVCSWSSPSIPSTPRRSAALRMTTELTSCFAVTVSPRATPRATLQARRNWQRGIKQRLFAPAIHRGRAAAVSAREVVVARHPE